MNQPDGLKSDTPRSQIFYRDNIEELISNYIQFERKKERGNRKQDQNNNAHGSCYGSTFRRNASYTYGMNHLDNSFMEETTMEWRMKNTQQELAEDYLELAKIYMGEKNYDKAEKFLFKAKLISPAKKIDEALAKLSSLKKGSNRKKARMSLFNDPQKDFDRLLNQADEELRDQNWRKAEELLIKAKKLNHNERVDILTTRIAFIKRQAANEEYLNFSKNANKDESKKCVDMAKQLMKDQDYDKAEKWLLKAKRLYPGKEVDLLLTEIYSMYNQDEANRKNLFNRDEAQKCVQLAEDHIAKKNYEKAKRLLVKAKKLYPSIDINENMTRLENLVAQQKNKNSNQFSKEDNKAEAKRCVVFALSYISESNYDMAEKFLRKAKKLDPEVHVEELLQEVENRKQQSRKSESYFFRVDMNKEEAERCLKMATDWMAQKNFEKARKLLMKAKKLYSMPTIDAALEQLELMSSWTNNSKNPDPGPSQKSQREYTKEQEEVVKRIMSCSSGQYFRILQIPSNADAETVKKAFKKLALEVHPDKNYAPGAEEAFKRLKKAYEVLGKESPKPNQNSTTNKGSHNQSDNNFQENSFNDTYKERSFNSRQWFNASFEEESRPRDNYSNHYRQESNSFNFKEEEPSFNDSTFHRNSFFDNTSPEPTTDPVPVLSKTQLIVLTVFSTILVIYVGKYLFFNNSPHITNHYHFDFYPEPTAEDIAVSQPNNLSTSKATESSLIKFLTEIEYRKHFATVCSKVASTYNFLSEVRWRDHTVGFVSFFYENTKSMLTVMKSCLVTVGQFSYPYMSAAYSKSTELCSEAYSSLVAYDWLNAWNKTKEISVSLVPWGTLGRIKNSAVELATSSYRSLVGPPVTETPQGTIGCANLTSSSSFPYMSAAYSKSTELCSEAYSSLAAYDWLNAWNKTKEISVSLVPWGTLGRIKNSAVELAASSYRSLVGPPVTETPQGTIGWVKDGCANIASSSYRSLVGYNWSNLWGSANSSAPEVPQDATGWMRSCINFGARSWNFFAGYEWVYIWTKSKDLCVALVPWSAYEWLRNNYLNSSFALTCLKTGARATVSSITYVSQSIYSMIKEK